MIAAAAQAAINSFNPQAQQIPQPPAGAAPLFNLGGYGAPAGMPGSPSPAQTLAAIQGNPILAGQVNPDVYGALALGSYAQKKGLDQTDLLGIQYGVGQVVNQVKGIMAEQVQAQVQLQAWGHQQNAQLLGQVLGAGQSALGQYQASQNQVNWGRDVYRPFTNGVAVAAGVGLVAGVGVGIAALFGAFD